MTSPKTGPSVAQLIQPLVELLVQMPGPQTSEDLQPELLKRVPEAANVPEQRRSFALIGARKLGLVESPFEDDPAARQAWIATHRPGQSKELQLWEATELARARYRVPSVDRLVDELREAAIDEIQPAPTLQDARRKIAATIVARQGQPAFRTALIHAYGGKCAVTGCDATDALEAAHIAPFMGAHTNVVSNGILLRADIHTLFDRGLLSIDPDTWIIHVAPHLKHTRYRELGLRGFTCPTWGARPDPQGLGAHFTDFCRHNRITEADLIPDPDADFWTVIAPYAITVDAYEELGGFEECARLANETRRRFDTDGVLPTEVRPLRHALFFEQRRHRFTESRPEGRDEDYVRALVRKLYDVT